MQILTDSRFKRWQTMLPVLVIAFLFLLGSAKAQKEGGIQGLKGQIELGQAVFYTLPNLKQGETLYVYASGESHNFDPFLALADEKINNTLLKQGYRTNVAQAIAAGRDPLEVIPEIADQFFIHWDDDSGTGYDAAFRFIIPADGDYHLALFSTPSPRTFGNFKLLVGVNTPEVLTGQATPTGDTLAVLEQAITKPGVVVEEITGPLTESDRDTFFVLNNVKAGDTVYAYVEATSGDLAPILLLNDFGDKSVSTGNFSGGQTSASLQYTFTDNARNYMIRIKGCCQDGPVTSGDYRLLIGINAPEVLTGVAAPTADRAAVKQPTEVQVGLIMEQITGVDQKSENFGVVADVRMVWTDPKLAFSPDECQCRFQTFTLGAFEKYLAEKGVTEWPSFTLFNQQGRRDSQNQLVVVQPNGQALYVERFSATLQAPDFDFSQFPFDTQQFYIRIRSVFPQEFFVYKEMENFSKLGEQLGEEEWVISDFGTTIDTHGGSSRFSFGFETYRHINFYLFRIFVPVLVIIIVSWITFFLKDYGKRIDVASANLLLFIAFNFTVSNDLPRLGYLTLMDTILISTFVVTALVIIFNVYLKRLEVDGKHNFAHRVDKYMIWVYPLAYITAFAVVTFVFK